MCVYTYVGIIRPHRERENVKTGRNVGIYLHTRKEQPKASWRFLYPSQSPHEITRDYIRLQRLQRLPQITGDYQRLPEIELAIVIYHEL